MARGLPRTFLEELTCSWLLGYPLRGFHPPSPGPHSLCRNTHPVTSSRRYALPARLRCSSLLCIPLLLIPLPAPWSSWNQLFPPPPSPTINSSTPSKPFPVEPLGPLVATSPGSPPGAHILFNCGLASFCPKPFRILAQSPPSLDRFSVS